jgi:hypothetical protein
MTYPDLIAALFPDGPPVDFADYALVLPLSTVLAMQAAQVAVGSTKHAVAPVATTDGRWLVSADILPELATDGIFAAAMDHFNMGALGGVEVMSWADGVGLLPVPDFAAIVPPEPEPEPTDE